MFISEQPHMKLEITYTDTWHINEPHPHVQFNTPIDIPRYRFELGDEHSVDIVNNGYLVYDGIWTHSEQLPKDITVPVKQLLTRIVTLPKHTTYTIYLPNNFEDLPNVSVMDRLYPSTRTAVKYKKRKIECWFCMSTHQFDTSLVTHIMKEFYISASKYPITKTHGLVIPIDHIPLTNITPLQINELTLLISNIHQLYQSFNLQPYFWITKRPLSNDRLHDFVSFVGVSTAIAQKLPKLQISPLDINFDRDNTKMLVFQDSLQEINNPRFHDLFIHILQQDPWHELEEHIKQEQNKSFISQLVMPTIQ